MRGLGFAEGVINACTSSDGGIYEFVPCFELMYCAVSEEYVPDGTWTPEDMLGLYEETGLPIFDPSMSRNTFLEYYLAFNGNSYIDGEAVLTAPSSRCCWNTPRLCRSAPRPT